MPRASRGRRTRRAPAGKPIALVKAGRTEAAARTARTHTGALAGADAVFDAFCGRPASRAASRSRTLCETLKIFHAGGPLRGRRVLVMGASGGDMAMTADAARDLGLEFRAHPGSAAAGSCASCCPTACTSSNPFDFHTHVWFDRPAPARDVLRSCNAPASMRWAS